MESTKKKSPLRTFLKLLVIAAILFTIFYHLPLHRNIELTVQDPQTGESAPLSMELTLRRSFFARTRVSGTLVFDGEAYTSVLKTQTGFDPLHTLQNKWSGLALPDAFCRDDAPGGLMYGDGMLQFLVLRLNRHNTPVFIQLYRQRDGSFWVWPN